MKHLIVIMMLFTSSLALAGDLKSISLGSKAPDFTLKNYDGKEDSLQSVLKEHKFTVLMFISTQCPVSNGYNQRMVKLVNP